MQHRACINTKSTWPPYQCVIASTLQRLTVGIPKNSAFCRSQRGAAARLSAHMQSTCTRYIMQMMRHRPPQRGKNRSNISKEKQKIDQCTGCLSARSQLHQHLPSWAGLADVRGGSPQICPLIGFAPTSHQKLRDIEAEPAQKIVPRVSASAYMEVEIELEMEIDFLRHT